MKETKAPREFWLWEESRNKKGVCQYVRHFTDKKPEPPVDDPPFYGKLASQEYKDRTNYYNDNLIHVIEYGAYDLLKKENSDLKAEIEKAADIGTTYGNYIRADSENSKLKKKIEELEREKIRLQGALIHIHNKMKTVFPRYYIKSTFTELGYDMSVFANKDDEFKNKKGVE